MAKRKYPPIKTVAYVHVGDQLVDTRDLNPEQKKKLGDWILMTWMQNLYRGEAVFWPADQPAPEGLVGEQL